MKVATLKKYTIKGESKGEVKVDDSLLDVKGNRQMIKDYIVALRANARQWSANTKGRSEVAHTTKKPYRQKGTGNARQGMLVTPQFRGGGIVFGPKPKFDQHVRINKKERRAAIRTLLAEKIKEGSVLVLDATYDAPKTKPVADFLKKQELFGRKVLFVGKGEGANYKLSIRNIPRASYTTSANINGYDLAAHRAIIVTEEALNELLNG